MQQCHASTLECLYDCLLDIMFLFCRNKLILILNVGITIRLQDARGICLQIQ